MVNKKERWKNHEKKQTIRTALKAGKTISFEEYILAV
jgi:hypothetical protein